MSEVVRRGSKGLLRDINNSRVLQILHAQDPISRSEIARLAELPPPTVTAIVNDFLGAGLVRETEVVSASVGRPRTMLTLNADAAYAVGVKLSQGGLTIAVTDLRGTPIYQAAKTLSTNDAMAALEQVAVEVDSALDQANVLRSRVLGLGIGMPGLIDHLNGVCRYSSLLNWRGINVKRDLEYALGMSVYVDNDVNMLTAAEIAYGAGREINDFLTVTIGAGIGLGIVARGEIYRGAFGGAGEFGHMKIDSDLPCECGSTGCLEAVASDVGICARIARAHQLPSISISDAIVRAQEGDEIAADIFHDAGRVLGAHIGNLLNLFNPELVVVTGEGVRAGALLLDPMRQAIRAAAFGLLGSDTRIEVQEWGDESWAQGAASIVVHAMFKSPIYESGAVGPLAHVLDRGGARAGR